MFVFLAGFRNDEIRFRAGTRLRRTGCNADIVLGCLRAGQVTKRRTAIETSRLTETLQLRRKRTHTTKHCVYSSLKSSKSVFQSNG